MTEEVLNEDRRKEKLTQMTKALEITAALWSMVGDKIDKANDEFKNNNGPPIVLVKVTVDDFKALIKPFFPVPLADCRINAISIAINGIIAEDDLTTCGLWRAAHHMDHYLWDQIEDLPTL